MKWRIVDVFKLEIIEPNPEYTGYLLSISNGSVSIDRVIPDKEVEYWQSHIGDEFVLPSLTLIGDITCERIKKLLKERKERVKFI